MVPETGVKKRTCFWNPLNCFCLRGSNNGGYFWYPKRGSRNSHFTRPVLYGNGIMLLVCVLPVGNPCSWSTWMRLQYAHFKGISMVMSWSIENQGKSQYSHITEADVVCICLTAVLFAMIGAYKNGYRRLF